LEKEQQGCWDLPARLGPGLPHSGQGAYVGIPMPESKCRMEENDDGKKQEIKKQWLMWRFSKKKVTWFPNPTAEYMNMMNSMWAGAERRSAGGWPLRCNEAALKE
jgi:hypothetical protein